MRLEDVSLEEGFSWEDREGLLLIRFVSSYKNYILLGP